MKKLLFVFLALALCFPGCAKSAEEPVFSAAASEFWYDGMLFFTKDDRICYRHAEGEERLLCFDPLCSHSLPPFGGDCTAALAWGRTDSIVAADFGGAPAVWFIDRILDYKTGETEGALYRFDFATGERKNLVEGKFDRIAALSLYGDELFFWVPVTEEANGSVETVGSQIWRVGTDGSGLSLLYESDHNVNIAAVSGRGKTRSYCLVDYTEGGKLSVTSDGFKTFTEVAEGVPFYGNFVADGYFYYARRSGETSPVLTAPAHPLDKNRDFADDGSVIVNRAFELYDYVRVPLNDPTAEAEIAASGVMSPLAMGRPVFAAGDRLYVIPCEPEYVETIAAAKDGTTITGDPADDLGGGRKVEVDYIVSMSGSVILETTLSGEVLRRIETPGFDPQRIVGIGDGVLFVTGSVTDGDRIRERLEEEGVRSSSFTFEETVTVPIS